MDKTSIKKQPTLWGRLFGSASPEEIQDSANYDSPISIASLLGNDRTQSRIRESIYSKWSGMESDAIISRALKIHVTAALMGNERTGDAVVIKSKPDVKDKKSLALIDDIQESLLPLFNHIDYTLAYNGLAFGDAYGRIYSEKGKGVTNVYVDELVRPPLIQPYEQANATVGYLIASSKNQAERLTTSQMTRLKMPRTLWIPQPGVIEKSHRMTLMEDDPKKLPVLPSMVGGSYLYQAEKAYDDLFSSMLGLVGQRWLDSIDEEMIGVNFDAMTQIQRDQFTASIKTMFQESKENAELVVDSGKPFLSRIRHFLPVFGEKQIFNLGTMGGGARKGTVSIEDVMMHAKLLAGALGVDLSMLGFADLLSGGLGEGGYFRTSAQVAESSSEIRKALKVCFSHIINVHTFQKYGYILKEKDQPWELDFYGSISALENEKQDTRLAKMNSASLLVTVMQQSKDMGMDENMMSTLLTEEMDIPEERAKVYAKIVNVKTEDQGMDGFGGNTGFGSDSDFANNDTDKEPVEDPGMKAQKEKVASDKESGNQK